MADTPDIETSFERALRALLLRQRGPAAGGCPDAALVSAYYTRTLDDDEISRIEPHLATCVDCQAELALLARLDAEQPAASPVEVRSEPILLVPEQEAEPSDDESIPFKVVPRRSRWSWIGPAALAASAVIAVSLTYRFADEASRRSLEPRSDLLPTARVPGPPPRVAEAPAPQQELQKPAAPPPADAEKATGLPAKEDRALKSAPSPAPPAAAMEVPRQARELAKAKSAPAVGGGETLAESPRRKQAMTDESERDAASSGGSMMMRAERGAPAAAARAPAAASPGIVNVAARTNGTVLWRFTGTTIERSDDGGQTWQRQGPAPAEVLAASAPSSEACWAVGRNGMVLRTANGQRWGRVSSPTPADLAQVTAWSESSATVKSTDGSRFSTSDGGATWSKR